MHKHIQQSGVEPKFIDFSESTVEQDFFPNKKRIVTLVISTFLLFSMFLIFNAWQRR